MVKNRSVVSASAQMTFVYVEVTIMTLVCQVQRAEVSLQGFFCPKAFCQKSGHEVSLPSQNVAVG